MVPTAMGNPGSNRDAEAGTWKLVDRMKIYETTRISIHVSDPLHHGKSRSMSSWPSALWEVSVCPELLLVRLCYTLTGVLSQSPPSTDTGTALSKWKIGMMKWEAEVSWFTKKLDESAGDLKKDSQLFISRKVQRTRRTCDPSNKQGELLFCWWWFRLEHLCQINTPPSSRIDWWSD